MNIQFILLKNLFSYLSRSPIYRKYHISTHVQDLFNLEFPEKIKNPIKKKILFSYLSRSPIYRIGSKQ